MQFKWKVTGWFRRFELQSKPRVKMPRFPQNITAGAENLLHNCANLAAGDRILIVHETAAENYYSADTVDAIKAAAVNFGAKVSLLEVGFDRFAKKLPQAVVKGMGQVDRTIFLARIADQLRFGGFPVNSRSVLSYALDSRSLGGGFGQAQYGGFVALKSLLESAFRGAKEIHVTCLKGTDFRGSIETSAGAEEDVSIARFPMLIAAPLPAVTFSGRVALPGFLVGTGSQYYTPFAVEFPGDLFAEFSGNELIGFQGDPDAVRIANDHYDKVSAALHIDRNFVHSWHVGIHPGCAYTGAAAEDYEKWSGSAFGNPRLLHFHTCGTYAPGEISWNVLDPTVQLDGVKIWEDGRLFPERVQGGAQILDKYPCAKRLFDAPETAVGI